MGLLLEGGETVKFYLDFIRIPKANAYSYVVMSRNQTSNTFSILADMLSDSEEDECQPDTKPVKEDNVLEKSPTFRTWAKDDTNRFQEKKTNIFSSPFTKKTWKRHIQEDTEGWFNIRTNKPLFQEESSDTSHVENVKDTYSDNSPPPLDLKEEDMNTSDSAIIWAERIKKSLERAESARVKSKVSDEEFKEALGRLSFFRRPLTSE